MRRDAILILGAGGFIGREIRRQLASDYRLLSVDLRPTQPVHTLLGTPDGVEERLFRADLGDLRQLDRLWERLGEELDDVVGIIHLAAHYDFTNEPHRRYERLQEGFDALLPRIARDVRPEAPFVYASSMAALAPTEPGVKQTPDSPKLGAWQYPASKIRLEERMAHADLPQPIVQLVLAGVYSDLGELVPLYQQIELVRAPSIEKFMYPGPPDRGLTYVHLTECADAFARALTRFRGGRGLHRFLIGQQSPVTYAEIHRRAARVFFGKELPLVQVPAWMAYTGAHLLNGWARLWGQRRFLQPWMIPFAGEHFEFDLTASREELGWEPWRSMHEDLDVLLSVAANHRDLWNDVNAKRPW